MKDNMSSYRLLNRLWARGCAFLGSRTAIIGGAMTWISEHRLVAAISEAGGFGVLACGSMSPKELREAVFQTQALTDRPFGVNLIVMHPEINALCSAVCDAKVSHVILAGRMPRASHIHMLRDGGVKVIAIAPNLALAQRLTRMGVEAIIIEGMEAGGHIGHVSTLVLAQEILPVFKELPVFVAGGIGRGEAIASLLCMGASGCQLGSRFACAKESIAHPAFKQALIKASARDAIISQQVDPRFPVIPVRALSNDASKQFRQAQCETIAKVDNGSMTLAEGRLAIEHFWAGSLRRAVIDGDTQGGSLMAGQSAGLVRNEQSVATIIQELTQQALNSLESCFDSL